MAPEQAAGQTSIDARADLYAVGVMAYEMLGGRPPFTGATPQAVLAAQVTQVPPPLASLAPELAAPLRRRRHALPGEGSRPALAVRR